MPTELKTHDQLKAAAEAALTRFDNQEGLQKWNSALVDHIRKVQAADQTEFRTKGFQAELWDSNAVAATGQGSIDISKVIATPSIVDMLWQLRNAALPAPGPQRVEALTQAWEDLAAAVDQITPRRPRLKMYRVFAALFPNDFTTISYARKLRQLSRAMGLKDVAKRHPVSLHAEILERLTQVLGASSAPPSPEGVRRMSLPWVLYATHVQDQGDDATVIDDPATHTEKLNPLPAARRRKGLLAIGGYLPSIRSMIEFAADGCAREDMKEHIRSVNPNLGDAAIATNLNALIAEWGAIKANGNELSLTPRGESLLETGEPAEVADWLLTRILGFDNALVQLRSAPTPADVLRKMVQKVNPGWKTFFAPDVLINWIVRLKLAEVDKARIVSLTPEGREWAERITWTPEVLQVDGDVPAAKEASTAQESAASRTLQRAAYPALRAEIARSGAFPDPVVATLDAGLWLNARRHFAVLTGLSGAGKTLLARSYGLALWSGQAKPETGTYVLPVQPAWQDASALLGYVSPLQENVYVRTPFLDFLLLAAGDPTRPYTVVLDEMNLSHPEQYLAPLLSAMETGDPIRFHTSEDEMNGVPPAISYPSNLVVIGTVNMDETTHGLSDKVLDRACVIDFWKVDVALYPGWNDWDLTPEDLDFTRGLLTELCEALEPSRLHFGWRTVSDIIGFLRTTAQSANMSTAEALDRAVYGKVLPKLRGEDTRRLRDALLKAQGVLAKGRLTMCKEKLDELLDDLTQTGSARFWR